jgi:polysaccharide export outer membrane protein
MKKTLTLLWTITALLLFTSCSAVVKTSGPLESLPVSNVPAQDYKIQVGDALDIKFFYHPELNESVVVRPDGRISLQLVHEVQASGLTPETLRENLRGKYEPQISKPEIAVIVRSFNAQKVYVDGEVAKPGLVPLVGSMTILQSIASAGGLKDTARSNEIILIRRGPENRPASLLVNVEKAIDGSDPSQDLSLQPADIVFVPKSPIANVNQWVDQYIRRNIPFPWSYTYTQ